MSRSAPYRAGNAASCILSGRASPRRINAARMGRYSTSMWSSSAHFAGGLHPLQRVHRYRNARARAFLRGRRARWQPGVDARAIRHPAPSGAARLPTGSTQVVVAGGGIAGIAAAVGLAERNVPVILIEPHDQLGGRVRAWPVAHGADQVTMSRGFHAFVRQYYNLRALLRRADPELRSLVPVPDYPLILADEHTDSFARIPRTPPLNLAAFVIQSSSFRLGDLAAVNVPAALELLDVEFPRTFSQYDGESAAVFLDRLHFPARARHLARRTGS